MSGRTGSELVWHCALVRDPVGATSGATVHRWSSGGTAHENGGGATSQLDLPSLTSLSVAGCGRLQLGVNHWATSRITASS